MTVRNCRNFGRSSKNNCNASQTFEVNKWDPPHCWSLGFFISSVEVLIYFTLSCLWCLSVWFPFGLASDWRATRKTWHLPRKSEFFPKKLLKWQKDRDAQSFPHSAEQIPFRVSHYAAPTAVGPISLVSRPLIVTFHHSQWTHGGFNEHLKEVR